MSGNNSVVECNLAKVEVASSNLVSRSSIALLSPVLNLSLPINLTLQPEKQLGEPPESGYDAPFKTDRSNVRQLFTGTSPGVIIS
jgi:hypothetical protein